MDFLTNPFIVALLFLYQLLGNNIVLTIVVFTVIVRFLVFPLTMQQMRSSKNMQKIQPDMKEIKEKYKGDREKQSAAQMELYRKHGINPVAGCLPLVVQLPILLGLYGAIQIALASSPLQVVDVSHRLLVPTLASLIPLQNKFLIWNLGQPDTSYILPLLVVVTTFLQQKLIMPANPDADPKDASAQMTKQMTIMMPLMIGFFSINFAAGLSIYWIVGNIVGVLQYALLGKVDIRAAFGLKKPASTALVPATAGGSNVRNAEVARPTSDTMRKTANSSDNAPKSKAEKTESKAIKTRTTTTQTFNATPKAKPKKT